jgi:hypothetical protein
MDSVLLWPPAQPFTSDGKRTKNAAFSRCGAFIFFYLARINDFPEIDPKGARYVKPQLTALGSYVGQAFFALRRGAGRL